MLVSCFASYLLCKADSFTEIPSFSMTDSFWLLVTPILSIAFLYELKYLIESVSVRDPSPSMS